MAKISKKQEELNLKLGDAIIEDELEQVKELISKGADVNSKNVIGTLHINEASREGQFEIVKLLVENGAKLNIEDNWGNVPLLLASNKGHLDIVKYLHQNGADVNANGGEAIKVASWYGHLDIVKYLVENGGDLDIAIKVAYPNFKEELIAYKEEILISNDLKEVKQEQQKPVETKKATMRI